MYWLYLQRTKEASLVGGINLTMPIRSEGHLFSKDILHAGRKKLS